GGIPPRIIYREFTASHLIPGTADHQEFVAGTSAEDRETLKGLTLLRSVMDREDDALAHQEMIAITPRLGANLPKSGPYAVDLDAFYKGKDVREIARKTYQGLLNVAIAADTHLEILEGSILPVVACANIRAAAFVFTAYKGISTCLNCGKQFSTDFRRPDGSKSELYCTQRCGAQYRQKVYRHNMKAILAEAKTIKGRL
ncbi:MAG: hypothetical protein WBQ89_21165, partial [Candidatus Acidiferrum sp.]